MGWKWCMLRTSPEQGENAASAVGRKVSRSSLSARSFACTSVVLSAEDAGRRDRAFFECTVPQVQARNVFSTSYETHKEAVFSNVLT